MRLVIAEKRSVAFAIAQALGDVRQGDEAILFGRGGMSIEDVAQIVGTINYELTCLVTERANRVYVNN